MAPHFARLDTSMRLHVIPKVDIQLELSSSISTRAAEMEAFEAGATHDAEQPLMEYAVVGPDRRVGMLRNAWKSFHASRSQPAPDFSLAGVMSPLSPVTLSAEACISAGIPSVARSFAFLYPIPQLSTPLERLNLTQEPWLHFFILGGWVYLDDHLRVVAVNSLTLTVTHVVMLRLCGPFPAALPAVRAMRSQCRIASVTYDALLKGGFVEFAWVRPNELFNGGYLGMECTYAHGAFLYIMGGAKGTAVYYVLEPDEGQSESSGGQQQGQGQQQQQQEEEHGGLSSPHHVHSPRASDFFSILRHRRAVYAARSRDERTQMAAMMDTLTRERSTSSAGSMRSGRSAWDAVRRRGPLSACVHALSDATQQSGLPPTWAFVLWMVAAPLLLIIAASLWALALVALAYADRTGFEVISTFVWFALLAELVGYPVADNAAVMHTSRARRRFRIVQACLPAICALLVLMLRYAILGPEVVHGHKVVGHLAMYSIGIGVPLSLYAIRLQQARRVETHAAIVQKVRCIGLLSASPSQPQRSRHSGRGAAVGMLPSLLETRARSSLDALRAKLMGGIELGGGGGVELDEVRVVEQTQQQPKGAGNGAAAAGGGGAVGSPKRLRSPSITAARYVYKFQHKTLWEPKQARRRVAAAILVQSHWRKLQARRRYEEELLQRRKRLLSFSQPIFFASLLNLVGNSVVSHAHAAGLPLDPTWRHMAWILLLVPCVVAIVRDLRSDAPPRFSITHVIFFVAVLYPATYSLMEFDIFVYNQLFAVLHAVPPTTAGRYEFRLSMLTPTLGLLIHMSLMFMLITVGKQALKLVAPANTRPYFLFPLQFFDFLWRDVFFNLRQIGQPVDLSWLLLQLVSSLYLFIRSSGIEYTFWVLLLPKWIGSLARGDDACAAAARVRNDNADPIFVLQFLAGLGIQYELADFCSLGITPLVVCLFVWRDGWFSLADTGLIVRGCDLGNLATRIGILCAIKVLVNLCVHLRLSFAMRKTLLGQRTIHGVSDLAARVAANRHLNSSYAAGSVANARVGAATKGTSLDDSEYESIRRELSMKNLHHFHLFASLLRRNYAFYFCVVMFELFAAFPVARRAPVANSPWANRLEDGFRGGGGSRNSSRLFGSELSSSMSRAALLNNTVQLPNQMVWVWIEPSVVYDLDPRLREAFDDAPPCRQPIPYIT